MLSSVSLFASANAGELSVSGSAKATYNILTGKTNVGKGLGVTLGYDALTVGAYAAEIERTANAGNTVVNDAWEGVWYAKYSMGPVSIGYSESYMDAGVTQAISSETTTTAKAERTAGISKSLLKKYNLILYQKLVLNKKLEIEKSNH